RKANGTCRPATWHAGVKQPAAGRPGAQRGEAESDTEHRQPIDRCCRVGIAAAAVKISRQDRGRERDGRHENQQQQAVGHLRWGPHATLCSTAWWLTQMIPIMKKLTKQTAPDGHSRASWFASEPRPRHWGREGPA